MSWDSKTAVRRRQNSSASSARALPHQTRQQPTQPIQPKSSHVADPFLQSFLAPSFDPAQYLNASLPPLQTSSTTRSQDGSVPLADLSAQAQTQLSQLNVHTTRLTNTLTQLTDDILRSGSRLAYEVELLRGETLSLSESLSEGLHEEIVKFVPDGIQEQTDAKLSAAQRRAPGVTPPAELDAAPQDGNTADPQFISQLQTLTLVRSRLDLVVKTFGDAMEFVFPPSELSVSSSFLSVSAPDPGPESHSTEEKGQQVLKQFRDEISDLLTKGTDPVDGIEKAARRIEELKELTTVWKGTAEEKGRTKFIDNLAKIVEDRHKDLMKEMDQGGRREGRGDTDGGHRRSGSNSDTSSTESKPLSGYGLMSQLQRLRAGL
ncbi:Uu.00g072850.m01.CDS01 [Anthostomella pinea]|uniref:Uu.00g072850.m01.CDS01 n=1 Tax=Anthostomella pinea TaxID=933095 RepID=A0AAI8YNY1_9PEZI|nr:Uu.00g072850.m01.CDS01 [Anthostomella pinea]